MDALGALVMALQAMDVFVPGAFPQHTYVDRTQQGLEESLVAALKTPGILISVSGPSKAGKTVLIEKIVGQDSLIAISGARIQQPSDVWDHVLSWMDIPQSTTSVRTSASTIGAEIGGSGSISVPMIGVGSISAKGQIDRSTGDAIQQMRQRGGLQQVVREIGNSGFVVLIDDFHYMGREVQEEVAKQLKEAIRLDVRLITAAVTHRGDDVVRANPELRGRLQSIDVPYWEARELEQIATKGFGLLNLAMDVELMKKFSLEAAGSPQLMQSQCLNSCFVSDHLEIHDSAVPAMIPFTQEYERRVMRQTSGSTDYRSLVDVLLEGPQTRGTERKTYSLIDGSEADVYGVVMRALASDPPQLSFKYDDLMSRVNQVCVGSTPVGSSVNTTCIQIDKLAKERFPAERSIEWDDQKLVLDIPDPYLLFYLRWSGRLRT